jgi:hypothetical protein
VCHNAILRLTPAIIPSAVLHRGHFSEMIASPSLDPGRACARGFANGDQSDFDGNDEVDDAAALDQAAAASGPFALSLAIFDRRRPFAQLIASGVRGILLLSRII